ncbi:Uncharacterized protein TCM_041894 [Theobroma cacao]|uniref:Uncharacterized protein n=1 Tax=Theobroma cacao TaxID=3641 RepID=A0A061GXC6_THECC|nr:Uncharacterized protein TCM_041894 [Theobroma cacao]
MWDPRSDLTARSTGSGASQLDPHGRIWHSTTRSNIVKCRSDALVARSGYMVRQIGVSLHWSHFRWQAHGEEERKKEKKKNKREKIIYKF